MDGRLFKEFQQLIGTINSQNMFIVVMMSQILDALLCVYQ